MSRVSTLILLGVLVALSPFVGLPMSILSWVLPVLGLMVLLTGISLRVRRTPVEEPQPEVHEPSPFTQ